MEPNKLEKQFREQLNSREIKPSEIAWDRLDAMLSVAEEKKTKRFSFLSFRFIGIAASILVLVTAGLFFFNQKNNEINTATTVVVNDSAKSVVPTEENPIVQRKVIPIKKQEQIVQTVNQKQQSSERNRVSIISQKSTINSVINQTAAVQNNEVIAQKELPVATTQTETVNSKAIDVNVDDLLVLAQKTLKADGNSKIKVNASSLLSQVDRELDQTFREKVVSRINKNYQEVKVALETRNQK